MTRPCKPIDAALCRELFIYEDGKLINRARRGGKATAGAEAGYLRTAGYRSKGYRLVHLAGSLVLTHRIIWAMFYGDPASSEIDHINCVRDDNRIENLRLATRPQNVRNRAGAQSNSTTGVRGVGWVESRSKYHAKIKVRGRTINLGRFTDIEEAKEAYRKANEHYFGEFGGAL